MGLMIQALLLAVVMANPLRAEETIKVGVLHSLSGTMAISETSLRDVVLMAIDEVNAAGGVLGKKVEGVVVDPASDWPLFAEKAKELIVDHKVSAIFGCWTSVSRKSVLPVIEEYNALLFYPVQYEGEEQSLNVFYTAASPNQQLVPAAAYAKDELDCKKFYLLGTDYVFPRTANRVLKAYLLSQGVPEENIMEEYTPFHHQDYQTIVGKIKKFAASGDACVLSTINGDSNVPFYTEFANQGLTSDDCPIVAFSVAEDELRAMDTSKLVGHLAAWNYFQSIDTPENAAFVKAFKDYCAANKLPGGSDRVTDDPIEAAYYGVKVWAAAANKAGSVDVDKVRAAVYGMEFDAPGGKKKMHASNQHTYKPVLIGEIRADGQFDIVWQTEGLVEPDSYSKLLWIDEEPPAPTGGPK
ncbi:MAG: urea ABC transporter substrate-binding protein [Planctomycetota bacterium]|nr:urea ABC transporter substrate-binding protein [Planctomycetota bacterium]